MRKTFIQYLSIVMVGAMLVTIGSIFILRSYSSQNSMKETSLLKMEQIYQTILGNESEIQSLKQSTNEDYLTRAKAFAYIVNKNPEVIEDTKELEKIKEVLGVDQLHVIDSDGILKWGTNPEYYNFDFTSSEQTAEFLPGITNRNFEYAQEAQPNGSRGDFFQYAGVARIDKPGIIQVGLRPERLEKLMESNKLSKILSEISMSENLSLFAIDINTNTILTHSDSTYVGKTIDEVGFPSDYLKRFENGAFFKLNGIKKYYIVKQFDNIAAGIYETKSELYAGRNAQLILISIIVLIIFGVLLLFTDYLLKTKIISGVTNIIMSLKEITSGKLDTVVNIRSNPEFSSLSDGLNEMVKSIKSKMDETYLLMKSQNEIIDKVKKVSLDISSFSNNMLKMSDEITDASLSQSNSINELSSTIDDLSKKIDDNAKMAYKASSLALKAGEGLEDGNNKIEEMLEAMNNITDTSQKIETVVKSIEDISTQTNLLALNAALEAAKAGEFGKGFAVVANEVRGLADESFSAVKGTSDLVAETIKTIEKGTEIATSTASTINDVMGNAKQATSVIKEISAIFDNQLEYIKQVSQEISQIAVVVNQNSETAKRGSELSQQLEMQVHCLEDIISIN